MESKYSVIPCNSSHSIKEAVISIFLANRIINPARFQRLIEKDFKTIFHQFNKVGNIAFQVNPHKGQITNFSLPVKDEEAGFNFIAYENGEVSKVLQARNEKDRYFISYHTTKYNRWTNFYEDYIKCLTVIANEDKGLFVNAVSVLYVDQFRWESNEKIDLHCIFKKSEWLPEAFFANDTKSYTIQTLVPKNDRTFINRIDINIDETNNIVISHNIVTLINNTNINELLNNSEFKNVLDQEHSFSKDFLLKILNENLLKLINLQK